jgi:hypothetical protein
MRLVHSFPFVLASSLALVACGGGGDDDGGDDDTAGPDANVPSNEGFVPPDSVTKANEDGAEVGNANWDCLGTANPDVPTTTDIALSGLIEKFGADGVQDGVTVEVFAGTNFQTILDTTDAPTDINGGYSLTVPMGHARYGFRMTGSEIMDTFLLNQYFEPANATQTRNISVVTTGIAAALPALVGIQRTEGTGVLAGAMRDCDGREVSFAVATVSSTAGAADHLEGAQTYYIDAGAGLPVRHDQLIHTDDNGLFAVFELPVTATAYIQIWGFIDDADLADGEMTLLAELASPVVADTVITGSIDPLRQ